MFRLGTIFILAIWLALPASAEAGAWTKRKYEGLIIAGLGLHWLDPLNQPAHAGHIKFETSIYAEFGLTDRITLVGRAGYQERHTRIRPAKQKPAPPQTGIGGLEAGVRVGLYSPGRWASAAQVTAGIPGSGENWINEEFGSRGGDVDLRLLLGRSIGDGGFVEVGSGLRLRGDEASNEVRLDLTAGHDFIWGSRIMVQSYSVWGLDAPHNRASYNGHRVQASLLLPAPRRSTVQLSVLTTVAQRNMSEEFSVMASLWRPF